MTRPTTCHYCKSIAVPPDLVCVRMCESCVRNGVDVRFAEVRRNRAARRRRFLRRLHRILNGLG